MGSSSGPAEGGDRFRARPALTRRVPSPTGCRRLGTSPSGKPCFATFQVDILLHIAYNIGRDACKFQTLIQAIHSSDNRHLIDLKVQSIEKDRIKDCVQGEERKP